MARGMCGGCEGSKSPPNHPGHEGHGAVSRGCADRAVAGSGQALPAGIADHRSGSVPLGLCPFFHSRWNPFHGSEGEGCWGEEAAGANAVVGVDVDRVIAVPVGDLPQKSVLREWGQASAEAMGREQTLAQLEGVAMG
jgi:hypothetical protein